MSNTREATTHKKLRHQPEWVGNNQSSIALGISMGEQNEEKQKRKSKVKKLIMKKLTCKFFCTDYIIIINNNNNSAQIQKKQRKRLPIYTEKRRARTPSTNVIQWCGRNLPTNKKMKSNPRQKRTHLSQRNPGHQATCPSVNHRQKNKFDAQNCKTTSGTILQTDSASYIRTSKAKVNFVSFGTIKQSRYDQARAKKEIRKL